MFGAQNGRPPPKMGVVRASLSLNADLEHEAFDHLVAGRSVDLLGVKGSGRSAVLRAVTRMLEDDERQVLRVDGIATLRDRPLEALAISGALPAGSRESTAVAAGVNALLTRAKGGRTVVVIDDVDDLDTVSAGVITAAHARARFPVLSSSRPISHRLRDPHRLPAEVRPGVELTVSALDYVGTQTILSELMPGLTSTELVRRVHSLSGGIPALVEAIAETTRHRAPEAVPAKGWAGPADLWSPELGRTIEPLVQDLSPAAREALETLALAGTVDVSTARRLVSWEVLEELDECWLLRFVTRGDDVTIVGVFPPVVAEYLRHLRLTARRLRLDESLSIAFGDVTRTTTTTRSRGPSLVDVSPTRGTHESDTILHRLLLEHWRRETLLRRSEWEAAPSAVTAVPYLRALLIGDADAATLQSVISRTPRGGDERELASLDNWHALVLAFVEHDLDGALAVLGRGSAEAEEWRPLLRSVGVHLAMLIDRLPTIDHIAELAEPGMPVEAVEVLDLVHAERLAFQGDGGRALALVRQDPGDTSDFSQGRDVVYGLALMLDGRLDDALEWAQARLEDGRSRLDVDAIHGHGYVVASVLLTQNRMSELRDHLASVLSTGLASATQRPYEAANLSLASGIALEDGRPTAARSFAEQSAARSLGPNPLPYAFASFTLGRLDAGLQGLVQQESDRTPADTVWAEVEMLEQRGYTIAALTAGAFSVGMYADPERAAHLLDLAKSIPGGFAASGAMYIRALHAEEPAEARREGTALLHGKYVLSGVRALAAAVRIARRNDGAAAAADERARALDLVRPHGPEAMELLMALAPAGDLTTREEEIARLAAGGLSNQQIATRLQISVRTVENHLLRAFRKLAITTRSELSRALGG